MQRYTGYVNATCPMCKEIVRSESVPGGELGYVRVLLKQIAGAYQRWFPFATVKVFDPLSKRAGTRAR